MPSCLAVEGGGQVKAELVSVGQSGEQSLKRAGYEVSIIARRGELVVSPERIVREELSNPDQRPITVMINVTADATSFRASQCRSARRRRAVIDRAATRLVNGIQFLGAMETVRVLPL